MRELSDFCESDVVGESSSKGQLAAAAAVASVVHQQQNKQTGPRVLQIIPSASKFWPISQNAEHVWQPAGQQGSWLVLSRLAGCMVGCCTPRRIHNHLDLNPLWSLHLIWLTWPTHWLTDLILDWLTHWVSDWLTDTLTDWSTGSQTAFPSFRPATLSFSPASPLLVVFFTVWIVTNHCETKINTVPSNNISCKM